MSGIINDLSSDTLALIANDYLGQHKASDLNAAQVSGEAFKPPEFVDVAQVYATLALVQAIRELTQAVQVAPGRS